tara:strand:+ start:3436 stop:4134 length:699 start_codon:yes stop_codon:yes gene_type:complete
MKYYHGRLDTDDYIFQCDNRPTKEVEILLKNKFNNIKIYEIKKQTFDLLKKLISYDNDLNLIKNINKLEKSLVVGLESKLVNFYKNKTLNDLHILTKDKRLCEYFLKKFGDECFEYLEMDESNKLKINSIDVDDYLDDYDDDYNIYIDLKIINKKDNQIDNIKINLEFYYDNCNGNYWCFKGDGSRIFKSSEEYSYKCITTDLNGNKIDNDANFCYGTFIEKAKDLLYDIGF